jgi:hypothetical protein
MSADRYKSNNVFSVWRLAIINRTIVSNSENSHQKPMKKRTSSSSGGNNTQIKKRRTEHSHEEGTFIRVIDLYWTTHRAKKHEALYQLRSARRDLAEIESTKQIAVFGDRLSINGEGHDAYIDMVMYDRLYGRVLDEEISRMEFAEKLNIIVRAKSVLSRWLPKCLANLTCQYAAERYDTKDEFKLFVAVFPSLRQELDITAVERNLVDPRSPSHVYY